MSAHLPWCFAEDGSDCICACGCDCGHPVCDVYPSCPGGVVAVRKQCASVDDGDRCDLPAGHVGRHEHTESRTWEPETVAVEDLFPPRKEQQR